MEEHNFVKENNESSRMFYFRHGIFIINQLFDRHVLELPLYYGMKDSQLKPRCLAKTRGSLILVEYFSKTLDWLEVTSYNQCWWVIAIFAIASWVDHHKNFKIYISAGYQSVGKIILLIINLHGLFIGNDCWLFVKVGS